MAKQIEYPAKGLYYCYEEYGVYDYQVFPRGSVLEGQRNRIFLGRYPTLAEAQAAHPDAEVKIEGSGYTPVDVSHLPDDEG